MIPFSLDDSIHGAVFIHQIANRLITAECVLLQPQRSVKGVFPNLNQVSIGDTILMLIQSAGTVHRFPITLFKIPFPDSHSLTFYYIMKYYPRSMLDSPGIVAHSGFTGSPQFTA